MSDQPVAVEAEHSEPAPADPPGWMLGPGHLTLVAVAGFFFLLLSFMPLQNADLWGHVIYGEWILEHRSLPVEDPVMPLAKGMPVVDTSWLSQAILAGVEQAGGAEWLSHLFALSVSASVLLLGRTLFLSGRSLALSMLGMLAAVALGWGRLTTLRSETFGVLAFVVLLRLITAGRSEGDADGESETGDRDRRRGRAWRLWLGIPLTFVVWANLDGSFVYGLAVLACLVLGRAVDVGWSPRRGTSRLRAVADDPTVRRWLYLTELAIAATLLNPYGIDLVLHQLFALPASPNLLYMPEWRPLVMQGFSALGFSLSCVALLFVFRHSRRRVAAADVLLLAFFAFVAATAVGRMVWYGPIFAWVVVPHLAEIVARVRHREGRKRRPSTARIVDGFRLLAGPSVRYTMLCATLLAIVFILSPIGSQIMGRESRPLSQLFGTAPLELAGYLAGNPPQGQVFNPASWGDWLALQGAGELRTFATTNVHLLPEAVWGSYRRVAGGLAGWSRILRRYRIDTVILHKLEHRTLASAMRFSEDWIVTYEDEQAMVLVRAATPADSPPVATAPEPAAGSNDLEEGRE